MKKLFYLIAGSFIIAYATTTFLNPNSVITGGGVGLAQLLHELFPQFTLGVWIAIVSIPLILIGMKYFGKSFVFKTLISITLISLFTDLLREVLKIQPATDETILAAIFGGLLVGLGVGLILLAKASTGGTTILAEVIAQKCSFKTSQILLLIDGLIMFWSIFVYNDLEKSLFSVIGIYITSRIIDILLSGKPAQKSVTIVTNSVRELSKEIDEKLGEHGTIVNGYNLKQEKSKTLILVLVDISKLQLLKSITKKHDQDAFLIIQEASELYGRED
ncbi:membrane protein [Arcobacter sp. CECT 8983]|uniref:YitT family protein n=1 Tax=Arcobacter sp. CECT 8983 TaxID=2044508 RepID=UPI00100AD81E|nr:YitT family protein [Arcobacter sp. CECT 8983]RXJ88480.1 membrane protein [Arcobacter sp. CECT 8983]